MLEKMRPLALAFLVAGSASAADPSTFCAAYAAVAAKKPPDTIVGGQGKCTLTPTGIRSCTFTGDKAKVRSWYEQASRELTACIDVREGIRRVTREADEKGNVTLASTQLKAGEWGVEVVYWVDEPTFTFRVDPLRAVAKPAGAPTCADVKALLSRSSSLTLPGVQKCSWQARMFGGKLEDRHDTIGCELDLEGYALVVKAFDTCLPGAKRSSEERVDARKKPAQRSQEDKWVTPEWRIWGGTSELSSSALLTLSVNDE